MDAEGLALEHSMRLADSMKLERVTFETDCTTLAEIMWFGNTSGSPHIFSWTIFCMAQLANHKDWQVNIILML